MNNRETTGGKRENGNPMLIMHGIAGSPGVVVGPARLIRSQRLDVPRRRIAAVEADFEWERFEQARDLARGQLGELRAKLDDHSENDESSIMDAHLMVLDDEILVEQVREEIFEGLRNSEWAVRNVANIFIEQFMGADDPYMQERADDISDVGRRIIRNLLGLNDSEVPRIEEPCIVVADNLTPSDTIALSRRNVKGIALDRGSKTSHAAIIARALEIPAVFGLGSVSTSLNDGDVVGLDGTRGMVIINPPPDDLARLSSMAAERELVKRGLEALRDLPAQTLDGQRIPLYANAENVGELETLAVYGAEGIGLLRTEYLWLASGRPVSEEQQTRAYSSAVEVLRGKPLVIRAFDLGGDKFTSAIGQRSEANPFLGMRSIRYLLRHPDIFRAQLRSILRAGQHGEVQVMFPLISDIDELRESCKMLRASCQEVLEEGGDCREIKVGAMIEVPSAALMADTLAEECDFLSIGTNDLTQYTLATDRINEQVAHLYQPTHPAVLKLIGMTIAAGRRHGIQVSACGEMASDPGTALLLLGMGIDVLSMVPAAIPSVKDAIRKATMAQTRKLAEEALKSDSAAKVNALCRDLLIEIAPELLPLTQY